MTNRGLDQFSVETQGRPPMLKEENAHKREFSKKSILILKEENAHRCSRNVMTLHAGV